ncbi:MAG: PAS domain S-box protein [Pseudomonadota bacterium]
MQTQNVGAGRKETDRLAALEKYHILDTSPEQAFDDVVSLAGQLLDAPIVAVNLIAEGRQWFKSEIGLGVREMPLDDSICKIAILQESCMVVPDTSLDPRFACNPLVTGGPELRFYAGEILMTPDGFPLGTLCVLDTKPRPDGLTQLQQFTLKTLAQQVLAQLELRKLVHEQQAVLAEKEGIETALRLEQERNRIATDAAQLGLWSWNPVADKVVWENRRPYEILGLGVDEEPVKSKRFLRDFVHPDDAPAFEKAATATATTGERFYFQGRVRRTDKQLRWLEFFGNAQHARDGTVSHVIGVVLDITDRKRAEIELLASRERFQTIVSQAATGVMEANAEGTITFVNQKYCQILGYTEAELLGKTVFDVTAPDSIQATHDVLVRLRAGGPESVLEKRYLRKDGSIIWGSASMNLLRSSAGEAHSTVSIIVDISENKKTEENLRKLAASLSESDRRKTEFLATLAHEMRNPLAPIRSGLNLMCLHSEDMQAIAKVRDMMDRQVTHLVHLVDDLLDIARISGGKIVLKKTHVSLKSLIVQAIETSSPVIDGGNHSLHVELPDESLLLDADSIRITQILANLLNNAAKYTPPGGEISIRTLVDQDTVLIRVTDSGVGIAQESLTTIFDMFSQVGESIGRAQGGLGIGLSLVKRLVEMHGGNVGAASAGEGNGSTFTVRLPLLPTAVALIKHPSMDVVEDENQYRKFRLLVADDNTDAAETLSMILALNGHAIEVAYNGIDAVKTARTFLPDIVFLDIGMPGMNGYEAAAAMRKIPGLESTILIALTGWGDESDRLQASQAGFDHHITKPVDIETVNMLLVKLSENFSSHSATNVQSD